MFLEQLKIWDAYPGDMKPHFHVVVTDDIKSEARAFDVFRPVGIASQQLYIVLQHRRWDWLAKRNLGVKKARTDWVLLTDIDHVLPAETLRALLSGQTLTGQLEASDSHKRYIGTANGLIDPNYIYRFRRRDARHPWPWTLSKLAQYQEHPNSWLMTRQMFDQMGGYDERFSGYYGSDSEFRERCKGVPKNAATSPAKGVIMLDLPLVRYPREVICDASTDHENEEFIRRGLAYKRKQPEDGIHVPRIKAARAEIPDWKPLRLTVPYELVTSC
jgi:glycosyltransferase involved in cell wall biosynthesis